MPKFKLTNTAIDRLRAPHPDGKQTAYWDTQLPGFGIVCSGTTTSRNYIAQRDLPGGKTRRVTLGAVREITLEQAREEASDALHAMRKGIDPNAHRTGKAAATLRQVLDDFLAARNDLRENTRSDYRATVERYLSGWFDRVMRDITADEIEGRHAEIQREIEARATKDKERYEGALPESPIKRTGKAAANGAMVIFRALWNFQSERVTDFPANPVRRLKRQWFPVEQRERMVPTERLADFYAAVDRLPSRTASDYLKLLLFTGLRRTEAASLRWDDVDLLSRVIRIPAMRTKAGRKLDLPMSDFVHSLLVARRALGKDGPFVFPSDSKAGFIAEPRFPLTLVAKACGVDVACHDLRRTYASVAESCDISGIALKRLLNHATGGDVTVGYVQLSTARLGESALKVADRMKELCKVPRVETTGENMAMLVR